MTLSDQTDAKIFLFLVRDTGATNDTRVKSWHNELTVRGRGESARKTCRYALQAIVYCADHAPSSLAWWRKIVDANDMQAVAEGAQP